MDAVEIPEYFICPISLQIMKDPVTISTGITYDRESIEEWLFQGKNTTCPVTKQPLPEDYELTPNHTLRRLIQAWCTANAVDRIPTPKAPLDKSHVIRLIHDLWVPRLQSNSLKKLAALVSESERNRKCMRDAGVAKAMVSMIIKCFREDQFDRLEEAVSVLHHAQVSPDELKPLVIEKPDLIESLTWVLGHESTGNHMAKVHALLVLKSIFQVASSNFMERLKLDFFVHIIGVLRERISQQATKAALHILLEACPWGRNRMRIVEAGAVYELLELELAMSDKRTTELVLGILDQLCLCADGRAKLLDHASGIALVSKRIFKVSPAADDRAVRVLSSVCKFSATNEVLHEMLKVGAVSKLCMVLQSSCATDAKELVRSILRKHSNKWMNSPCVAIYLLSNYS